ncbi:hypothetical protein EVAR_54303_1 [Eumeta japonica]|uniref:Uncharacterized protein n=1 Tax=Eumeta variegata TaxID=151549 RepID=A0A4C1Z263_EUMVA|nr:hypothetical protein EVAR_54303_1 [Eumeta japonica]
MTKIKAAVCGRFGFPGLDVTLKRLAEERVVRAGALNWLSSRTTQPENKSKKYEEGTKNSLPKTSGAYTEAEAERKPRRSAMRPEALITVPKNGGNTQYEINNSNLFRNLACIPHRSVSEKMLVKQVKNTEVRNEKPTVLKTGFHRLPRIYYLLLPNILNAYYSYTYYSEYFSLSARQTTNYQETTDTPTELCNGHGRGYRIFTQDVNNMRRKETKNCSPESQVEQGASLGNGEIDNEYEEGTKNSPKTSGAYTQPKQRKPRRSAMRPEALITVPGVMAHADDLSNMSRKSKSILKPQNLINKFQKMEILPEQQAEMSSTDEEEDLDTMLEDALKASI